MKKYLIDKEMLVKKWSPVIETLGVTDDEKIENMAIYAENCFRLFKNDYMPVSMKILSKLDNFSITNDEYEVENKKISVDIKTINDGSIDEWISGVIEFLKDKNILVYSLIDSYNIENNKITINSKIKYL